MRINGPHLLCLIGLMSLGLFSGCEVLGAFPNDPPPVNDHDAELIGSWKNDSSSVEIVFDGDKMTSTVCDSASCIQNTFPYRTHDGSLYKDFITTHNCDSNGNNCQKISEFPSNSVESYEVFSSQDSLRIEQFKYHKI